MPRLASSRDRYASFVKKFRTGDIDAKSDETKTPPRPPLLSGLPRLASARSVLAARVAHARGHERASRSRLPLTIQGHYRSDLDEERAGGRLSPANLFALAAISLLLVKQACDLTRDWRGTVLNSRLLVRLRRRLFARLLRLPLTDLAEMKSGGITSRLSGDVDAVSGLVNQAIIQPGVAAIRITFTVAIVLYLAPKLAAVSLLLLPPLAIVSYVWLKRVRPIYRSMREDRSSVDARTTEDLRRPTRRPRLPPRASRATRLCRRHGYRNPQAPPRREGRVGPRRRLGSADSRHQPGRGLVRRQASCLPAAAPSARSSPSRFTPCC